METRHSPAFEPVCDALHVVYDPLTDQPMPLDLRRLTEALDAAMARGELDAPPWVETRPA